MCQFSLSVFGFYIVFVLLFVQRFMKLRQTRKQRNPFYQASDDCTPGHTNNNFVVLGFASQPVTASRGVCLIISQLGPGCNDPSLSNWRVQSPSQSPSSGHSSHPLQPHPFIRLCCIPVQKPSKPDLNDCQSAMGCCSKPLLMLSL